MNSLIPDAMAQGAGAAPAGAAGGGMMTIVMMVMFVAIFYFLLIRPQQKRVKEHKNLVASLKKGDEVITNGGLLGRLTELGEHFVTVELAENVEVKLQRQAIAMVLPKGTLKNTSNN